MHIVRSVSRWFSAFALSMALSLWIVAAALTATIANRDVVKQWLATSGIYQNALGSILQVSAPSTEEQIVSSDLLQQAFAKTFDAEFVQQGTNTALDATFDWLEGKKQAITFSIPVQEKAAEFRANLAALVQPKLETLPQCAGRIGTTDPNKITCLPAGISAQTYAEQLTRPSEETSFLNAPLTQESLKSSVPQIAGLPIAVQGLHSLVWSLPIVMVVLSGVYVLASPDKLLGGIRVARRLTIGAAIMALGGLFLWLGTSAIDVSTSVDPQDKQQMAIATTLLNPLVRTVIPDFGRALTLYSGIVVGIGGVLWLGFYIWRRSRRQSPGAHIPPASPTETQLPQPAARPSVSPKTPPRIQ